MNQYQYFYDEMRNGREKMKAAELAYFTPAFYATFISCVKKSLQEQRPAFNEVFKTEFYQDERFAYCYFLEVFYGSKIYQEMKKEYQHKKAAAALHTYKTDPRVCIDALMLELLKIFEYDETARDEWLRTVGA